MMVASRGEKVGEMIQGDLLGSRVFLARDAVTRMRVAEGGSVGAVVVAG